MKQFEKGRSMIEMLGVLAIIGVLSVGGLSGYTMAMNRYRANTILDYVTRAAVLAQTHGTGTEEQDDVCTMYNGNETAPSNFNGCRVETSTSTDVVRVTGTVGNEKVAEALTSRSSQALCVSMKGTAATFLIGCSTECSKCTFSKSGQPQNP